MAELERTYVVYRIGSGVPYRQTITSLLLTLVGQCKKKKYLILKIGLYKRYIKEFLSKFLT